MPEADLEPSDDEQQSDDNPVIRDLRQKAKRAEDAESRATNAERELAVHKAGLGELTDKQKKALSLTHEGEWEPDALKATATELGFGTAPAADPPDPKIPSEDMEAMQRVAAAQGAPPAPPSPDLNAAIAAAESPEALREVLAQAGMLAGE